MADLTDMDINVLRAVLRLHDNAYGIPVRDELETHGRRHAIGTIYAALDRLEEAGFVKSRVGEPTAERGGRAKRYFKVTAPGQKALAAALEARRKFEFGFGPNG